MNNSISTETFTKNHLARTEPRIICCSHSKNNPIRYNDPSGHRACDGEFGCEGLAIKKIIISPKTNEPSKSKDGQNQPKPKLITTPTSSFSPGLKRRDSSERINFPSPNESIQSDLFNEGVEKGIEKSNNKSGQLIAGALLIILTDVFIGLPLFYVVVSTGGVSPPAVAAEILEIVVVLPINLFGIYLIEDAMKK